MTNLRLFVFCLIYSAISCAVGWAQETRPDKLTATAQKPIDGYWEGFIERQGAKLGIKFEIKTASDGIQAVIDIPDL